MIIVITILSGYFTLMLTAINESHRGRLEKLTENEGIFSMLDSPGQFISAAQIGITLTAISGGLIAILSAPVIFKFLDFIPATILTFLVIAIIILLFGKFLPQKMCSQTPEHYLIKYHKSFKIFSIILRPISEIMIFLSNGLMLIFGMNAEVEDSVTEDEIKDLIEQGREAGTFEKEEQAMVDRIFQLGDETAYSLMTPRTQIIWLDLNDPLEHNIEVISKHKYDIFPVGDGNLDDCRGVLYAKDLLDSTLNQKIETIDLNTLLKKPMYVPRTMEAFRLLEKFRNTGVHESMVLDEYGGVVGFITLDDLLKEIIGSDDNTDLESTQFSLIGKDTWFVDGLYDIDDFKKRFNIDELPEEEHDHFQTMGGFLTSYFGRIPNVGDKCKWNNLNFEVARMDRARIDKIRITKIVEEKSSDT